MPTVPLPDPFPPNCVGELRRACAYKAGTVPVVLTSDDPVVYKILSTLRIVRFTPDTTNPAGEWDGIGCLKIVVASRKDGE